MAGDSIAARCVALLMRLTLTRYLAASVLSLCVDMGLFLTMVWLGLSPAWSAILGYIAGIAVHWLLSVRFVFHSGATVAPTPTQRIQFLLSGLMGVAITGATVSLLTSLGLVAALAKIIAVAISFTTLYLVRKHVVFQAR